MYSLKTGIWWFYVYYVVSLDIPLRREYQWFYVYYVVSLDIPLRREYQWFYVYYVVSLDIPLRREYQWFYVYYVISWTFPSYGPVVFLCMVLSDHTIFIINSFSSSTSGARQGLK